MELKMNVFLKNIPLFTGLHEPELAVLSSDGVRKPFPRNALIIQQGAAGDALFIVLSGKVKVFLTSEDGKEVTLSTLGPGDFVGEMALIDNEPRSAGVMTMEPSEFFILSRADFRTALQSNANLAINLMKGLCQRLRITDDKIGALALLDVYGRVARTLMQLAKPRDGQYVVTERISQQEIANMVGASREMVNRIFRDLTAAGHIRMEEGRIVVNQSAIATH